MARKFYTILTDTGAAKIARAILHEEKIMLAEFAVGDGNGGYYQPEAKQTALRNEVYRGTIDECIIDKDTIKVGGIIPGDVGGFTINEVGAFDVDGDLIAVSNTAATEKPLPIDGITYQLHASITITVRGAKDCIETVLDHINYNRMLEMIQAAKTEIYNKTLYPGKMDIFAGSGEPPGGWLLCNGAEISRTTYADLFAAIGTTYGSGDGLNTFNLPDLTARFVMGDTIAGQIKEAGLPEISGRTLLYQYDGWDENTFGAFQSAPTGGGITSPISEIKNIKDTSFVFRASRSNPIYGNSNTVQPPAVTMKYIIKY